MGKIVLTNDDGVAADGLRALHRAMLDRGLDVLVVAPTENRSGVARKATYSQPVALTAIDGDARVLACSGTPVDCIRAALLGDIAPEASLVVSGINHGPNLGDDTLNSGTVGAAIEGALLGVPALAFSQQSHFGFFHILDSIDQTAPVYDETAAIAALISEQAAGLEDWPDRLVLNVNVPAGVDRRRAGLRTTRLGRRYYERASVLREDKGYRTFGEVGGPAPPFEDAPGTDFSAIAAGDLSVTPLTYSWGDEGATAEALVWTESRCGEITALLRRSVDEPG